jgi:hypothetical protein
LKLARASSQALAKPADGRETLPDFHGKFYRGQRSIQIIFNLAAPVFFIGATTELPYSWLLLINTALRKSKPKKRANSLLNLSLPRRRKESIWNQ